MCCCCWLTEFKLWKALNAARQSRGRSLGAPAVQAGGQHSASGHGQCVRLLDLVPFTPEGTEPVPFHLCLVAGLALPGNVRFPSDPETISWVSLLEPASKITPAFLWVNWTLRGLSSTRGGYLYPLWAQSYEIPLESQPGKGSAWPERKTSSGHMVLFPVLTPNSSSVGHAQSPSQVLSTGMCHQRGFVAPSMASEGSLQSWHNLGWEGLKLTAHCYVFITRWEFPHAYENGWTIYCVTQLRKMRFCSLFLWYFRILHYFTIDEITRMKSKVWLAVLWHGSWITGGRSLDKSNREITLVKEMSTLVLCLMKWEVNFVKSLLAVELISVFLNLQSHRGVCEWL